jgi:hypothetical protein
MKRALGRVLGVRRDVHEPVLPAVIDDASGQRVTEA